MTTFQVHSYEKAHSGVGIEVAMGGRATRLAVLDAPPFVPHAYKGVGFLDKVRSAGELLDLGAGAELSGSLARCRRGRRRHKPRRPLRRRKPRSILRAPPHVLQGSPWRSCPTT